MVELKPTKTLSQKIRGEGRDNADRQKASICALRVAICVRQNVERGRRSLRQLSAHLGQRDPARIAFKQRGPYPLFQDLYLIAHGGLGHAQLVRRSRKRSVTRGSIKGANGR